MARLGARMSSPAAAAANPGRMAGGPTASIRLVAEPLLHPSPGGIGRYTALLLRGFGGHLEGSGGFSQLRAQAWFCSHPRSALLAALGKAGVDPGGFELISSLLPRPLAYRAWQAGRGLAGPTGLLNRPAAEPPDLVHAPSLAVPPAGRQPLVVSVHDAAVNVVPGAFSARAVGFHLRGMRDAAKRAAVILTVSEAAADDICRHTPMVRSRVRVVHHGVDPPAMDEAEAEARTKRLGLAGRPFVLWVGSLEPRKGVDTLVGAMAELSRSSAGAEVALVLAGYEGWLSSTLIGPADRSALGDRLVRLTGVSERDLWALYRRATLFASPSLYEGFGLPVLEAMSQARAVVASDIPAHREVAGHAALLVAPRDKAAWVQALEALLANESERHRLGRQAAARAALFTVERFWRATTEVYAELLGGHGALISSR